MGYATVALVSFFLGMLLLAVLCYISERRCPQCSHAAALHEAGVCDGCLRMTHKGNTAYAGVADHEFF